jgi:ATP-dependent DNA helicase RecG
VGTTTEQIDMWRRVDSEHQSLEFKEAKLQFDTRKLSEYCVAIANEGGGRILLGVTDRPPRAIVGTQAFRDPVVTAERLLDVVGFRVDIDEVTHPDGRVLVFHVPSRPRGTAYHLDGKYLMRSGEALVPMSEDRLRAVFSEGKPHWLSESARQGLSDTDVVHLLDSHSYFDLSGLPYPATRNAVLDRFEREGLIAREPAGYVITRLAAVLFAKQLEQFEALGRKASRVIVYDGKGKLNTKRERTLSKGYAASFNELEQFIDLQTPAEEIIEHGLRREVRMYPTIAIRELVANALIHQDFAVCGASVMIEIYEDRIEISNPGQPGVQPERFIDEYRARNEQLADFMRRFGICEEKGSGVDKVVHAAEQFRLPAPEFCVDTVRTTCILYGHRPFTEMSRADRIRACYQHCCLRYVTREPMTNQSLRWRFGLGDERAETASRILREALEAGLIKLKDPNSSSKKFARYVPYWA